MKRFLILLIILLVLGTDLWAQCAMCTKTAQQLGEKPALGLNQGILYLMATPFLVIGVVAYRFWKGNKIS